MNKASFNVLLLTLGLGALMLGIVFYLNWRSDVPWLLLWITQNQTSHSRDLSFMQSMPSGLHAFGFSCFLGACWGGSRLALLGVGFFWFLANSIWEWACQASFPWVEVRTHMVARYLLHPGLNHACTFDTMDILAAAVGAAIPLCLHVVLRSRQPALSSTNGNGGKR